MLPTRTKHLNQKIRTPIRQDGQIFFLLFPSRYLLNATLIRFQEFRESKSLRRKIFSFEHVIDAYAKEDGKFTYFYDWHGSCIPSSALEPFYRGKFNPLTNKGKALLKLFSRARSPFMLTATYGNPKDKISTIKHEFVHALYGLNKTYARSVKKIINRHRLTKLKANLMRENYHREILDDEVNAYLLTGIDGFAKGAGDISDLRRALYENFKIYFGYSIRTAPLEFIISQMETIKFN